MFGVAKNMKFRPVASKNTKNPPPSTKEVSKQPSKVAEVITTSNAFDALGDLDEHLVVSK